MGSFVELHHLINKFLYLIARHTYLGLLVLQFNHQLVQLVLQFTYLLRLLRDIIFLSPQTSVPLLALLFVACQVLLQGPQLFSQLLQVVFVLGMLVIDVSLEGLELSVVIDERFFVV